MPKRSQRRPLPRQAGPVWRIKYRDAAGRQVHRKRSGPNHPGQSARPSAELGRRLEARRGRIPKAYCVTFADFADRFVRDYLPGLNLKPTTARELRLHPPRTPPPILRRPDPLRARGMPRADRCVHRAQGGERILSKSIQNHLLLLNVMMRLGPWSGG